jgi:hypothetical protein
MKSTKTAIILVIIAMFFVGCSKNMDYPDPIQEALTEGNFSVNYFYEGQDKTASYSGYVFEFENNGILHGTTPTESFHGTWQQLKKVDGPAISISITTSSPELQKLNRQWDVVNAGNAKLELKQSLTVLRLNKP